MTYRNISSEQTNEFSYTTEKQNIFKYLKQISKNSNLKNEDGSSL